MKNLKIILKLIILFVLTIGIITAISNKKERAIVTESLISSSDINSKQMYNSTLKSVISANKNWVLKNKNNTSNQPEIIGQAGMAVEINSGDIVFSKEANIRRPIASLVKIMTAVVALEHKNIGDKIYVSRKADFIGENSMGISMGEIYTLEELLYGLIMHSGNDAAYAIAENVAGDSDRFVEWMNIKAEELNLKNTHFADPSGLDDNSYSTPKDLIKLTKYALESKKFRDIVNTVEHEIYSDKDNKYIYLYNQTNLLTTYPGVAGVKTGYTEEAGLCLVTYVENEDKEVVGVVLNSIDRKGDMTLILDHTFETYGIDIYHNLF